MNLKSINIANRMTTQYLVGFLLAFCSLQSIAADSLEFRKLNVGLLEQIVIPAYRHLFQSAVALNQQAIKSCKQPSDVSLNNLRDRFSSYVNSWMSIEFFRNGPAKYLFRQNRIQYWPDKHNVVGRQLRSLLTDQNASLLDHSKFTQLSVGVQGVTALELLFYGEKAFDLFTNINIAGQFRCQFIQAISYNQQVISEGLIDDWIRQGDGYRNGLLDENNNLQVEKDIGIDILRLLYGEVDSIKTLKIVRPLDKSIEKAKPYRAELWRSGLSMTNIRQNLQTIGLFFDPVSYVYNFYNLENSVVNQTETSQSIAIKIDQLIGLSQQQLAQLSLPINEAVSDEHNRQILLSLVNSLEQLANQIKHYTTVVYQSPLGFNSFDGD
jgi:predicted lipoprotein